MSASDSSDSEDDARMRQFMEAADSTLLAMFPRTQSPPAKRAVQPPGGISVKSQRYLPCEEQDANGAADIQLPDAVRDHVYNKLRQLLAQQVEFCDLSDGHSEAPPQKQRRVKSRVKLLQGADDYINPDLDLATLWPKGPERKPSIKRRRLVEATDAATNEDERLQAATVLTEDIRSGADIKQWAKRREREVFHYKAAPDGVLHAIETITEFTQQRRKNKWHEAKIKAPRQFR